MARGEKERDVHDLRAHAAKAKVDLVVEEKSFGATQRSERNVQWRRVGVHVVRDDRLKTVEAVSGRVKVHERQIKWIGLGGGEIELRRRFIDESFAFPAVAHGHLAVAAARRQGRDRRGLARRDRNRGWGALPIAATDIALAGPPPGE